MPSFTEEWLIKILKGSANGHNTAFSIARIIEYETGRKFGTMHLAVKMVARKLERQGRIVILAPKTEHDSYTYCLQKEE